MVRHPRWLGARATRILVLVFVIFLFFLYQPTCIDPTCNSLKSEPTNFSSLLEVSDWPPDALIPQHLVRQQGGSSGLDIDDRYVFIRYLGNGREGAVSIYQDTSTDELVAIKRFQSAYRNPVPAPILNALGDKDVGYWPAEIQATLLLGGFQSNRSDEPGVIPQRALEDLDLSMLPALDYFLVRGTDCCTKPLTWHLVTPYLGKGTLTHLAKSLQKSNQTTAAVDDAFRPAFTRLLSALSRLHKLGVCHNDVKPDNIYILDDLHWLLGDLVRQHPRTPPPLLPNPPMAPRRPMVLLPNQRRPPRPNILPHPPPPLLHQHHFLRPRTPVPILGPSATVLAIHGATCIS
ncbi:MAG: hypothetical protein Q9183_006642 [Haloplaca sp. 2 TL-2023]